MKKVRINECVCYTALWCIYYLQGILYPSGSIISQGILLIILMLSVYYLCISFTQYKLPSFLKALTVFVGVFIIYFLASYLDPTPIYKDYTLEEQVTAFGSLKSTLMSLLPIFAYYNFSRKGYLTAQNIPKYFLCLIILVTLMFIRRHNDLLAEATNIRSTREEFTNNISYYFLHLIPLLVHLHRRPIAQYATLLYIMLFLLVGMKRGAILIGIACVIYFIYQSYKNASRKARKSIVALTVIASIAMIYFAKDFIASSDYFRHRFEDTLEGNSSGRDFIYSSLVEHILSREYIGPILWGEGLNHSVVISGNYAHNDWLELGVNMGLVGVLLYVLYFTTLGISILNVNNHNKISFATLLLCCLIMFSSALFSMSYNNLSIGITMALGYSLASRYSCS